METVTLPVKGLNFAGCAREIEKNLGKRSEERRVGKECRSLCDWSSDVCSSDLEWQRECDVQREQQASLVVPMEVLLALLCVARRSSSTKRGREQRWKQSRCQSKDLTLPGVHARLRKILERDRKSVV